MRDILSEVKLGERIPQSEDFRIVLARLEYWLPELLAEVHPEWHGESLDGILPMGAHKRGIHEIEIYGQSVLITDQTLRPIHLQMQIHPTQDEISWLELKLGAMTEQGMSRRPYKFARIFEIPENPEAFQWAYHIGFGERRSASAGTVHPM